MTGNSSKFFRKILKTGLVTASGAAIMLSSSGALGAAARTTTAPGVNFGTGAGLDGGGAFVAGSTLQFTGVHDVASASVNILAVDMNNNTTTAFVANNISIGSIVDTSVPAGGKISVNLNARTLTLTGKGTNLAGFPTFVAADNIYTALDSITFNGDPAGVVTVQSYNNAATTLSGDIISKVAGFGTLNLNTDTQIDGTIGATNSLATISVGASTATLGGAVIKATTTNLTNNASVLTFTNPVTVTGNIDNTGNVNNGVVNFNGAGNSVVTGTIGNTASLAAVNFKGAGAVAITGTSNATTFTVGNAGAAVTATGLMTGKVAFTAGGTLTPNGGIAGDVNVSNGGKIAGGKDVTGDLVLSDGAGAVDVGAVTGAEVEVNAGGPLTIKSANNGIKFTGTAIAGTTINVVDNAASNVGNVNNDAVNGAGTGILNFLGAGTAGTIGANNSLAAVNFKGAGAVAITGTSNATTFTVGNAGADVTATGLMTGKVAFTADGQLTLGNGITDTVTTAANNTGKLIVTAGDVGGAIGTNGGDILNSVTFNGASNVKTIDATTVAIGAGGDVKTTGAVTADVNFTGDGQLTLGNGITGAVTTAVNNEGTVIVTAGDIQAVGVGGSSLKQVTFNNVGASNAGNIFATDVTVGNAGTDVTTGTVNGAIDFTAAGKLNAGALVTGTAVFNADGQLTLGNGITGAVTTAVNNEGTVIVTAGDIQAVGVGGSSLKQVTFNNVGASNAGNIFATDVTVGNAGTDVTTGTVNGAIDFTAAGKLNAGALVTGTAVFNADGQLTLGNGITGAVTTAVNDEGTLIVTAGNVADIGVGTPLKQITFNGASILNGAIDAKTITINGAVTAKVGTITGNVNITSGTLTTNKAIIGDLDVSGTGNLAGDAATTNVQGEVTLQAGATGVVTIKNAINAVAVAGGTLNLVNALDDMTITGGTVNQTGTIGGKLTVSNAGNLAGDAAATNVTGTVTLQNTATGIVTIKDALNPAAVSVAGGTLNIRNAVGGINFTGNADATVNVVNNGDVHDVNNTTPEDGIGILNFTDAGTAGAVGATKSLKEVRFSGAGVVTLDAVTATNINFANTAVVDASGNITANIDFKNNDGAIILAAGKNITGTVGSTIGINGTLRFFGDSTVTETIGGAAGIAKLALIQVKGDDGNVVDFNKDVSVTDLQFSPDVIGPASTIKIGGNLTGNVTFYAGDNNGGTLEFNGNAANTVYDFKGAIAANANKGTLNVNTDKLIAYDASVGTLKQIDIQNTKMLQIDASAGDVTVLGVGKSIAFVGANSNLGFSNLTGAGAKNIKFAGNLPAVAVGGGGKLAFIGGVAQGDILNVNSDVPGTLRNIGAAGDKFTSLTIGGYVATQDLDLTGINQLDIAAGANFIDNSGTSPNIGTVNIGAAAPTLGIPAVGAATYTIDAGGVNVPILTPGKRINFADADAELVLQNSSAVRDGTITLLATLDPGAVNIGKLTIDSGSNGKQITLANVGGATYGTNVNKLKEFAFAGNGTFKIDTVIYAGDLELLVPVIGYGVDINSNLSFGANTQLSQGGNINGNIDFKNQAAVITLDDGKNITGSVTSSNGVNA